MSIAGSGAGGDSLTNVGKAGYAAGASGAGVVLCMIRIERKPPATRPPETGSMHRILLAIVLLLAAPWLKAAPGVTALWIDVRSAQEFAAGHLPGAVNLPYQDIAAGIGSVESDKSRPIKLYCGIGVRAQMAKYSLEAQGYRAVSNEGGYADLARAHGNVTGAQ